MREERGVSAGNQLLWLGKPSPLGAESVAEPSQSVEHG